MRRKRPTGPAVKLFEVTLFADGQLAIDGHAKRSAIPLILRMIAESIERGETIMTDMLP